MLCAVKRSEMPTKMPITTLPRLGYQQYHMCHAQAFFSYCLSSRLRRRAEHEHGSSFYWSLIVLRCVEASLSWLIWCNQPTYIYPPALNDSILKTYAIQLQPVTMVTKVSIFEKILFSSRYSLHKLQKRLRAH